MSNMWKDAAGGDSILDAKDAYLFTTTHWTAVLAAGRDSSPEKAAALEQLCQRYWRPVYVFIRRRGAATHDAEDLTQAFFARLLEKTALLQADPQKGKFRTFLMASVTNFLTNEWDKRQTLKRGGGHVVVSLDETAFEEIYLCNQDLSSSADRLFDRRWARTLFDQTLVHLKAEYAAAGKTELFETLVPGLTGKVTAEMVARCAARLELTDGAVKMALHRLRRGFGEFFRAEIAHTVSRPEEIDEEIRYLFAMLSQ
jgi:RNA polymerase sigma factor (sigma-70 family)